MSQANIILDTFKVTAKGGGTPFYCNAAQFEKNKDKWVKVSEGKKQPEPAESSKETEKK